MCRRRNANLMAMHAGLAAAVRSSPVNAVARALGINLSSTESGLTVDGPLGGALRRAAYWCAWGQ